MADGITAGKALKELQKRQGTLTVPKVVGTGRWVRHIPTDLTYWTDALPLPADCEEVSTNISPASGQQYTTQSTVPLLGNCTDPTCYCNAKDPYDEEMTWAGKPKSCKHEWTEYVGFTQRYEFCTKCDEKRESK